MHCKKRLSIFPSPADVTNQTLRGGEKFNLDRESLVSDIPAGDRKIANLFLQCVVVSAVVSLYDRPMKIFAFLRQTCIKIGLAQKMSDPKCCISAKEIKVYLNKHKVGPSFYLLFVAAIAAMQTAACRPVPSPPPGGKVVGE
jgi:hypothetical protein